MKKINPINITFPVLLVWGGIVLYPLYIANGTINMYTDSIDEYTKNMEVMAQRHEEKTIDSNMCQSYLEFYVQQRDACREQNGKPENGEITFGPVNNG